MCEGVTASRAGDVEVLRVSGLDDDLAGGVQRAVAMAFAEATRGLVVAVVEAQAAAALAVHAAAAALAEDWRGLPVVLSCPSAVLRAALQEQEGSRYVAVTETVPLALAAVLASPPPTTARRGLSPHPTSPRAARGFVGSTLLDWQLPERVGAAELVASELVTNAMLHARSPIDLRLAAHEGAVRISVGDAHPDLTSVARPPADGPERRIAGVRSGRGLAVVAALAQRWGVLPTSDGGKAVWAVLDPADAGHEPGPGDVDTA